MCNCEPLDVAESERAPHACCGYGSHADVRISRKNQNCQCLTYGGYLEANVGVAGCVGWDEVSVGGQTCEPAPTFRLHTSTAHTS